MLQLSKITAAIQFALRSLGVGSVMQNFAQEYLEDGRLFGDGDGRKEWSISARCVMICYDNGKKEELWKNYGRKHLMCVM